VISRGERALLVATPIGAVAAVAVGLGLGGHGGVRAAVVYAAPSATAGTGLAWQVIALEEERGVRQPLGNLPLDVVATSGDRTARWKGTTNADGVAEVELALQSADGVHLEVRAGSTLLAEGEAVAQADIARPAPASPWLRFARRDGTVVLDVAILGERAAPGFPAQLWVRAADAKTRAPLSGVDVTIGSDPGLTLQVPAARTDSGGWAEVVATPVGLAVDLTFRAQRDALAGDWMGGFFMSPGGSRLETRSRWAPDEDIEIAVQTPVPRTTAYLEVDDMHGRAWAAALDLAPSQGAMPRADVHVPRLAPGLYWAVASNDPAGAAGLGAGTTVRPFFVARSDEAALAFGPDASDCAPPRDSRDGARRVASCLALAAASPVPRWTAVEGFSVQYARDARRRGRGLAVALCALLVAVILETVLLLRTAASTRARFAVDAGDPDASPTIGGMRGWSMAVALLVVLLGFALLGAFLVRLA
jgi:hypothetical protein